MACSSARSRRRRSRMLSKRSQPRPASNAASSISAPWPCRHETMMNPGSRKAFGHPPLKGEGRTAEGSPGWGHSRAADDSDAACAEALPPPGPLTRADLPPAEPRYSEGSATQQSDRSRQQPTSVGGGADRPLEGDNGQRRIAFRFGLSAEARAAALLMAKGYRILARRFRTPLGEIDIVARRSGVLVFVEVKARDSFDTAAEAIGKRQQSRIVAAAQLWLAAHPEDAMRDMRFDA